MAIDEPFKPDTKASPRLYRRHQRYANYSRLRYGAQERAWLTQQAERLESAGADQTIFDYLYTNTAGEIKLATNVSHLNPGRV
jgi:hypothetical protein